MPDASARSADSEDAWFVGGHFNHRNAAHITTLGLSAVVEELNTITSQYSALIEQRTASQLANKLDAGKTVRLELDEQYDDLIPLLS